MLVFSSFTYDNAVKISSHVTKITQNKKNTGEIWRIKYYIFYYTSILLSMTKCSQKGNY